jgi:hypothetical protein
MEMRRSARTIEVSLQKSTKTQSLDSTVVSSQPPGLSQIKSKKKYNSRDHKQRGYVKLGRPPGRPKNLNLPVPPPGSSTCLLEVFTVTPNKEMMHDMDVDPMESSSVGKSNESQHFAVHGEGPIVHATQKNYLRRKYIRKPVPATTSGSSFSCEV